MVISRNDQILVAEVPAVVEAARAQDYILEEALEAFLDVQGFLLVEEQRHQ